MAKTTTQKGLGHIHQEAVKYLKQKHRDGSPCDICGRPMWLNPVMNYDYDPDPEAKVRGNGVLQGDHSTISRKECMRKGIPIPPPDRLVHAECNRLRGAGLNDHLVAGTQAEEQLSMPWPW